MEYLIAKPAENSSYDVQAHISVHCIACEEVEDFPTFHWTKSYEGRDIGNWKS